MTIVELLNRLPTHTALCVVLVSILFIVQMSLTEAAAIERVDGLMCWNGDVNYPIYSTGTSIGNALDVSSANIEAENDEFFIISVLDVAIEYKKNRIIEQRVMKFQESKKTGRVTYWRKGLNDVYVLQKKEDKAFGSMNDAYYVVKHRVGKAG